MNLSARNQLPGIITSINRGDILVEVVVKVGDNEIAAVITKSSAERLDLKVGDSVAAVIKATEVMIAAGE